MDNVAVFLGLGSNIGDRAAHIDRAVSLLGAYGAPVAERAPLYRTAPWGRKEQNDFYNTVVRVRTGAAPEELLGIVRQVEACFAERTGGQWGPRELDADILLYGSLAVAQNGLSIPHPRMAGRRFVLMPLADIAPDAVHPVLGRTVLQLLRETDDTGAVEQVDERSVDALHCH